MGNVFSNAPTPVARASRQRPSPHFESGSWTTCLKVFGVIVGLLVIIAIATDDRPPPLEVGAAMPRFSVNALDSLSQSVSLDAHRGKVVLLSVWATWCGSCASALEEQGALVKEFGGRGLHAVALSVDAIADSTEARKKLAQLAPNVEGWLDTEAVSKTVLRNWGVPQSYLIGRDGKLIAQVSGVTAAHGDVWRNERGLRHIREALAQSPN